MSSVIARNRKSWRESLAGYTNLPSVKGGLVELMQRLECEGHTLVRRGRRYFVEDFEKKRIGR